MAIKKTVRTSQPFQTPKARDRMTDLTLQTPECFKPLDQPSRYKAAYGGRGSGKSWHFASMIVEHCLLNPGAKVVCIREIQKCPQSLSPS